MGLEKPAGTFIKSLNPAKEVSTIKKIFQEIYEYNMWGGTESVSGPGSSLSLTKGIIKELPKLIDYFNIKSILDAPCGDFHWMQQVKMNIQEYIGVDIVPELIEKNNRYYSNKQRKFLNLDILADLLPTVDLIICRDCLVHFSFQDIWQTLKNFQKSGSKYLLTTTFTDYPVNKDINTGDWRHLNFAKDPFNFPEPLYIIKEMPYADKSLALWELKI